MPLDLNYLHRNIKKKWFRIKRDRDHLYCWFYLDGTTLTSVRSRCGGHSREEYKTLPDGIVASIWKRLQFDNKDQFFEFLDCPFTKEQYQDMLFQKGVIRRN